MKCQGTKNTDPTTTDERRAPTPDTRAGSLPTTVSGATPPRSRPPAPRAAPDAGRLGGSGQTRGSRTTGLSPAGPPPAARGDDGGGGPRGRPAGSNNESGPPWGSPPWPANPPTIHRPLVNEARRPSPDGQRGGRQPRRSPSRRRRPGRTAYVSGLVAVPGGLLTTTARRARCPQIVTPSPRTAPGRRRPVGQPPTPPPTWLCCESGGDLPVATSTREIGLRWRAQWPWPPPSPARPDPAPASSVYAGTMCPTGPAGTGRSPTPAGLSGTAVDPPPRPADHGGALLDPSGRVSGILEMTQTGTAAPTIAFFLPGRARARGDRSGGGVAERSNTAGSLEMPDAPARPAPPHHHHPVTAFPGTTLDAVTAPTGPRPT